VEAGGLSFLASIDWARPWLQPLRPLGQAAVALVEKGHTVAEALNQVAATLPAGAVRRFVSQSALPEGEPYERFIFETGSVPTRDNLHDFFNGLCWLHYPHTKARLNQLQAEQIALRGIGPVRGPVRDALTLFDENAAVLLAPPAIWQALTDRAWHTAFCALRPAWGNVRVQLFGHALMEQLVSPRKSITAHVFVVQNAIDLEANIDLHISVELRPDWLAGKPFIPLPVLGVPGWWEGNQAVSFYDDASVFRPRRASKITTTIQSAAA
jgi:hypothetical protein